MLLRSFLSLGWLLLCAVSGLGAAPAPVLVKDIQEGMTDWGSISHVRATMGSRMFFLGFDQALGEELWVSDGTASGTRMVKDINPGPASAIIQEMVVSGGKLFFSADNGVNGMELWVSNGTEAGTQMVADLTGLSGRYSYPTALTPFRGGIMFVADSTGNRTSLWKTDGTAAGTFRVKELTADDQSASNYLGAQWVVMGSYLYFSFESESSPMALWKSDGTPEGTMAVTDSLKEGSPQYPHVIGGMNNAVYFNAYTPETGSELWKTNGTEAGTVMVKDINPGPFDGWPGWMVMVGGKGFFKATTEQNGEELWMTDGTAAGTRQVGELEAGTGHSYYDLMVPMNGKLLATTAKPGQAARIVSYDPLSGQEKLILNTASQGAGATIPSLAGLGTSGYFAVSVPSSGIKLWKTNGTTAGTVVHDAQVSEAGLSVMLTAASSQVFFWKAVPSGAGGDLWRTDGTEAGLREVLPVSQRGKDGDPAHLRTAAGALYFAAKDDAHGAEVWRSDGTAAGTVLVKDIRAGVQGSSPKDFCELNGVVYFLADDGATGAELWRTDGTEAGTYLLKDIFVGTGSSNITEMCVVNGRLLFAARNASAGVELWTSNGTAEGTLLYANLYADTGSPFSSSPHHLTVVNGSLYFVATTSGKHKTLFRTDGTSFTATQVGTLDTVDGLVVRPPVPGAAWLPGESVLFFLARSGGGIQGLYRCSVGGSPELVRAIGGRYVDKLLRCGSRVVYSDVVNSQAVIWSSDGTTGGTEAVNSDNVASLVGTTEDRVYFSRYSPSPAFRSSLVSMNADGSDVELVMDLAAGGNFLKEHAEGKTLYFTSQVSADVYELWLTQGSGETTRRLEGVWAIREWYNLEPYGMQRMGSRLYFPGFRPELGRELFAVDLQGVLEVTVQRPRPLGLAVADGGAAEMGAQAVGVARVERLRLRNAGVLPLTGVAVSTPALADYGISMTNVGTLAGGAAVDVEVTFTPQAAGLRETQIVISGVAEGAFAHEVMLRGEGLDATDAPVLLQGPLPQLVLEGTAVEMTSQFASAVPLNHTWYRGKVGVSSGPALTQSAVQMAQGGLYTVKATNAAGSLTSPGAALVVVGRLPETVEAPEGGVLSLPCLVSAPAVGVTYQWLHLGVPLTNADQVRGAQSALLQIGKVSVAHEGEYACVVTMTTAAGTQVVNAGSTMVTLLERPEVLVPEEGLDHFVTQAVEYQVQVAQTAIRVTATGLPPGLKMDSQGLVTGRPTLAKPVDPETGLPAPYVVKLTATNAAGTGETATLNWRIRTLLPAGIYEGLLERNEGLDGSRGLGSLLKVTTTTAGAISGQLTLGGKVHRFAKGALRDLDATGGVGTAEFSIPQARGVEPLRLVLQSDAFSFAATLHGEDEAVAAGAVYRLAFDARNPAPSLAGRYTWLMEPESQPPGDEDIPNAAGYMTATISKTGLLTWRGKLADGTAVTGSSGLLYESDLAFALHKDLYGATGSVHGWVRLQGDGADDSLVTMSGLLDWKKAPLAETSKVRLYKQGIPLHYLTVTGGSYRLPAAGERVIQLGEGLGNASFTLSGLSVMGESLEQMFTVTEKNAVRLPKLSTATPLRSLSLSLSLGTFKGTLVLTDDHPLEGNAKPLKRTVAFEGVIVYPQTRAEGFGLVPQLPEAGPPETNLATSKIHACKVLLGPGTGLPD
ncbi:MAG: ELWxxDGT repeat protein [Verrucomicrobiota bacterium]